MDAILSRANQARAREWYRSGDRNSVAGKILHRRRSPAPVLREREELAAMTSLKRGAK
jgi:hypothetical protein